MTHKAKESVIGDVKECRVIETCRLGVFILSEEREKKQSLNESYVS